LQQFADFNQELLESLGVKRAVVVGESLGWIAADVVLRAFTFFRRRSELQSLYATVEIYQIERG
jgi:hypothetical protein